MDDLIEALNIMRTYFSGEDRELKWPTHCEHDTLYLAIMWEDLSDEHKVRMDELGFHEDDDTGYAISYKFGSC
jgi:hypothetical protein